MQLVRVRWSNDRASVCRLCPSPFSSLSLLTAFVLPQFLIALSTTMSAAFQVVGTLKPQTLLRSSSPANMMMSPAVDSVVASIPTTMAVAENETLLLASGGLISFIFLFVVVGTIVTNFGIMKKN